MERQLTPQEVSLLYRAPETLTRADCATLVRIAPETLRRFADAKFWLGEDQAYVEGLLRDADTESPQ